MDSATIGVRTHDMNPGLLTVSSGLINTYLRKTRLMGSAAQVITLLSGLQVVRFEPLLAAAGELGLDDSLLEKVLAELQELDQIRLIEERTGNHRIEVRVRQVHDRYEVIGERWSQKNPTPVEEIAIDLLEQLSIGPRYEDEVRDGYDLPSDEFDMLRGIMTSCAVIDSYTSPKNGRTILFSPIYWEENPEKFFQLAEVFGSAEVTAAMLEVRGYQGLPEAKITLDTLKAVAESGLLPATTVVSAGGARRFLFTPIQGAKKVDKKIMEKAFALISCIRYGQHHAKITRLRWTARELLEHLRDAKKIGRHSEARAQYSPLVELFVGRIERESLGRYSFHLYDTPENMRALDIAIQLTSIGEKTIETPKSDEAAAKLLLPPGSYHDPSRTRIEVKGGVKRTEETSSKIAAIISGVSSDVV